mmetsp:Transcript_35409/g.86011  ORF Transcript_35409/g.86011 Transcript_35409/m.86011 type:complete len:446 (-) Transcript_35409:117-1454(-)
MTDAAQAEGCHLVPAPKVPAPVPAEVRAPAPAPAFHPVPGRLVACVRARHRRLRRWRRHDGASMLGRTRGGGAIRAGGGGAARRLGVILVEPVRLQLPVLLHALVADEKLCVAKRTGSALAGGDDVAQLERTRARLGEATVRRLHLRAAGGLAARVHCEERRSDGEGFHQSHEFIEYLGGLRQLHRRARDEEELEGEVDVLVRGAVLRPLGHVREADLRRALRRLVELLGEDGGEAGRGCDVVGEVVLEEVPRLAQVKGVEGDKVARVHAAPQELEAEPWRQPAVGEVSSGAHADEPCLCARLEEACVRRARGDVQLELANGADRVDVLLPPRGEIVRPVVEGRLDRLVDNARHTRVRPKLWVSDDLLPQRVHLLLGGLRVVGRIGGVHAVVPVPLEPKVAAAAGGVAPVAVECVCDGGGALRGARAALDRRLAGVWVRQLARQA